MNLEIYNQKTFEDIKHINDDGIEFWYARELQEVLGYAKWGNFLKVIEKAKQSLQSSNIEELDHFADVGKIVKAGVSSKEINDMILSRYACYLIVQNGDPRKKMIALGQQYFAIQTRKQELTEKEFEELSEDERRLILRKDVTGFNKKLFAAAKDSGVNNFAQFNNAGYRGLYGGETAQDIGERKGLKEKEHILDHMGSTELAANLFRITQTEERLKKGDIQEQEEADSTHYKIGEKVRETMKEISGITPEQLPTPDKSIKQLEHEKKKLLKKK
ncbi:DNA damage-inducible protein D [Fusobacterium necrophorum]|uniref:DNA damage-inducible protein D n=1 Tax=Fusobacterium necrophorum BL TaxID=1441732 RepID=A0AB73BW25_9FUSO|nr:DNA damage-inducible protein D [Fusobacterium necrophorum]AYZ73387.1 DNA damage-inducible protein D [Fusobacterium necrophorum]AZW08616.1 DNA damage-inducible protein D [Fusobacterium necrophorum subsp. necrophorum]KDE63038.1 DNA damage-inducible protein D [Fusobacterium necrophorum BL]KDE68432.1 DNA damage-inducible protein D [Fusobacterium necrophorum DAB]KDE71045.1 DNA damage-inducible protein D [Fusobacterium necrophorum BFTR-2]